MMINRRSPALTATALLAMAGPLAAPAQAQQSRAEVRVNTFVREYREAVLHKGHSTPAQALPRP